ncbi:hypothetical protein CDAR_97271 [Caerostris darwini]|uniref:Uncharacterized protein n=1 Tax=Caerostris darwini TaxID=1538125 RepID=A0AAV4QRJ7_9ARAC|nr:hypothetical protein CDAR_97271 [Caerostris darwini]
MNENLIKPRKITMRQNIPGKSVWLLNGFRTSRGPLDPVDPSDHLNQYWGPSPTILCISTCNSSVDLCALLQNPRILATFSKLHSS